jgi:outer membrane protein assembly factor BamB
MNLQLSDLLFTGFDSRVTALHRDTGKILWEWQAPYGMGSVSLLPDRDRLIVSVNGYTYALDACTGAQLWMNPKKGYCMGVSSLASMSGSTSPQLLAAEAATQASFAAATSFAPPG